MTKLEDKVLLVCGAATGIGAAVAQRLHADGARVAIADINEAGAQALADALGDKALAIGYDQSSEESIQQLIDTVIEHYGQLDGVLANAADMQAILEDGDLLANGADIWRRTLDVNVSGTALLFRAAIPHLEARGGTLLATSSDAATVGEATRVAYAASKAAINAICRHAANRWGKQGIRCNVISPGLIMTEQLKTNLDDSLIEALLANTPSPRHGTPEDIAAAAAFLFSEDGEWVNGQVWHVNGGVALTN